MTYQMVYARGKRITIGGVDKLDPDQARLAAKKIAADHCHAKVGIGEDPIEKRERIEANNYLQFLDQHYRPHLEATLRNGVNNSRSVKETMANLINRFPEFHKLGLNEITPHMLDRWRQRRSQEGASIATIKRQLNDLSACLNKAISWGALSSNPFDKVEPIKPDSRAKVRFLSDSEELKIRAALDEREAEMKEARASANLWRAERSYKAKNDLAGVEFADYLKPAVILSLNTGLRRGELLSLRWSDIDMSQSVLTVAGDGAKSGQTRHIPLNAEALALLKDWKHQQSGTTLASLKGWVFPGRDGQPLQNLRKAWIGILSRKAVNITDFRWHDLRHTFASKLVMAGVDLNTVRELLGHSDYKMTLRYAHLAPRHKQDAVNKLVTANSR